MTVCAAPARLYVTCATVLKMLVCAFPVVAAWTKRAFVGRCGTELTFPAKGTTAGVPCDLIHTRGSILALMVGAPSDMFGTILPSKARGTLTTVFPDAVHARRTVATLAILTAINTHVTVFSRISRRAFASIFPDPIDAFATVLARVS